MNRFVFKVVEMFAPKLLDGYKTKVGAVGMILLGLVLCLYSVVGMIGGLFPDQGLPTMTLDEGFTLLAIGWGIVTVGYTALGIGGKMDKQTAALKEVPPDMEAAVTRLKCQIEEFRGVQSGPTE
jgi:hypothetical protein